MLAPVRSLLALQLGSRTCRRAAARRTVVPTHTLPAQPLVVIVRRARLGRAEPAVVFGAFHPSWCPTSTDCSLTGQMCATATVCRPGQSCLLAFGSGTSLKRAVALHQASRASARSGALRAWGLNTGRRAHREKRSHFWIKHNHRRRERLAVIVCGANATANSRRALTLAGPVEPASLAEGGQHERRAP
jgi:hypothetical protein